MKKGSGNVARNLYGGRTGWLWRGFGPGWRRRGNYHRTSSSIVICASNSGNIWYSCAVKISELLMKEFPICP